MHRSTTLLLYHIYYIIAYLNNRLQLHFTPQQVVSKAKMLKAEIFFIVAYSNKIVQIMTLYWPCPDGYLISHTFRKILQNLVSNQKC